MGKASRTIHYLILHFEKKEIKYIGKPFSVLLDSLKINRVDLIPSAPPGDSLKGYIVTIQFNYSTRFKQQQVLYWHYYIYKMFQPFEARETF